MSRYLFLTLSLLSCFQLVSATPRYDELLCEEVAEVVNESVAFGYMTKEDADHVIDGCYYLFLPNYS
jgi:hypothetical protein